MEQALSVWAECIALVVESIAVGILNYFLEKDIEEARSAPDRERIEA